MPRDVTNLLVAGRCFSTDRKMQGSTRVMPGCYITGQAAGIAAAMAVDATVAPIDVDVSALKGRLRETGAYIPN